MLLCSCLLCPLLFHFSNAENMNECLMCLLCLWFCFVSGVAFVGDLFESCNAENMHECLMSILPIKLVLVSGLCVVVVCVVVFSVRLCCF